jgi:hypothetical protein
MHLTLLLIVVNISMKNPTMRGGDTLWTKFLYFIIFCDLDLSYVNLNYMFHTGSCDNDHLCFNLSVIDKCSEYTFSYFYLNFDPLCVTLATGT